MGAERQHSVRVGVMFAGVGVKEIGSAAAGIEIEDPSGVGAWPAQAARAMGFARKAQRGSFVIGGLLATSKSGTLWKPRDQVLDGGLLSSLRALL